MDFKHPRAAQTSYWAAAISVPKARYRHTLSCETALPANEHMTISGHHRLIPKHSKLFQRMLGRGGWEVADRTYFVIGQLKQKIRYHIILFRTRISKRRG